MKRIGNSLSAIVLLIVGSAPAVATVTSVSDTQCSSMLDVTVASSARSSTLSSITDHCQSRVLTTSAGFVVSTSNPSGSTVVDSSAMVSSGGELFKAYVGGDRDAAVLLTPNRAVMMSRGVAGDSNGVDWNMGLAVQPVTSGTNAWLIGTYSFVRANIEFRAVDSVHQTNATLSALSQVFDPVSMRVTFDGAGGCSVANYSSWFSYALTTDPAGGYSQPNPTDYGLHQAVYAGAGATSVHADSNLSFTDCQYSLGSDGKLLVSYSYTDGLGTPHLGVENAYFVSSDLRYIVPTVNSGSTIYRGFEMGVRVKTLSGTQDDMNDSVAGTFLFNSPSVEWQGATGVLGAPYNEHRNSEKSTQCIGRGSLVLSTNNSATVGWNSCTLDITNTCSVRGEEGTTPSLTLAHYTDEGASTAAACRFQVSSNGSLSVVVNLNVAEGAQDVTLNGAVADNSQALVLRGNYVGSNMTNPSDSNPPQRTISNDMLLMAMIGIKHNVALTTDAFNDFIWSSYRATPIKNDFDNSGTGDLLIRSSSGGDWRLFKMSSGVSSSNNAYAAYTGTDWQLVASEDFDADGDTDILLRNNSTGAWRMFATENGAVVSDSAFGAYSSLTWVVAAVADFNGDGTKDVLLHSTSGAGWRVFYISNLTTTSNASMALYATGWNLMAAEDFDGDGDADIVLRSVADGYWRIFTITGGVVASNSLLALYGNTSWTLKAAKDFDNDGDADIVMRGPSGDWRVFNIQGNTVVGNAALAIYQSLSWDLDHVNDVDGDGDSDLILRSTTGDWRLFSIQNRAVSGNAALSMYVSTAWHTVDTVDVDGNGIEDVILNNTSTGAWRAFMFTAGAVSSNTNPGLYQNTAWTVQDK